MSEKQEKFILPCAPTPASKSLPDYKFVMIIGEPKSGKTTLATTFPDPIILDFECGTSGVSAHVVNVDNINTFKEAIKALRGESGRRFKTVVIDTIDAMVTLLEQETIRTAGGSAKILRDVGGYGLGYDILRSQVRGVYTALLSLPQQIVWLVHAKSKVITEKGNKEGYVISTLDLPDKAVTAFILAKPDISLYLKQTVEVDAETGEEREKHILYTKATDFITGVGSRAKFASKEIVVYGDNFITYDMLVADFEKAKETKER